MNRFRALLSDPGNTHQERPVQILGNDRQEIDRWAEVVLKAATSPDAKVVIFETVEREIASIQKPKGATV
jgi:hypothetical protein